MTLIPTDGDKAYAAGFFDGEGHITIAAGKRTDMRYGVSYSMRCGASQNDLAPLLWLQSRWGGSIYAAKRKTSTGNVTHHWTILPRNAKAFLTDVLPYLIVKRERAELALEFQSGMTIPGVRGHSLEHHQKQASFKARMNQLNTHKPATVAA